MDDLGEKKGRTDLIEPDQDVLNELLDDAEIQGFADELVGIFKYLHFDQVGRNRERENLLDQFEQKFKQSAGYQIAPDLFLATLHRKALGKVINEVIQLFGSGDMKREISVLSDYAKSHTTLLSDDNIHERIKIVEGLFGTLRALGLDRFSGKLESSPFGRPFDSINPNNPIWAANLEVAENFCHAANKLFSAQMYIASLRCLYEGDFEEALKTLDEVQTYCIDILPAVVTIFRSFQSTLFGSENKKETISVDDFGNQLKLLMRSRFSLEYEIPNLPIEVKSKIPDLKIENVDVDKLTLALKEIMTNALREGKVTVEELRGYVERGEAYLTVTIGEAVLNDKKVLAIEITDKGTQIDVHGIIDRMGDMLKGWKSRDITFGQILDHLSQRHVSIPLKGSDGRVGEMSTGIGLHSARNAILANNGEMFPVNLNDGVSFLVVIPKEGQDADWNVSEEKVSGADCGEISEKIAAARADFRKAIAEALCSKDCDDKVSVKKKSKKPQNSPSSTFAYA